MNSRQHQFVSRASVMAIPNAEELARLAVDIGRDLECGQSVRAVGQLEALSERMHHFLNFVALAEVVLRPVSPDVAAALRTFKDRVYQALDRAQAALETENLHLLSVILTRSLGVGLLEYRSLGGHVAMNLRPEPASYAA